MRIDKYAAVLALLVFLSGCSGSLIQTPTPSPPDQGESRVHNHIEFHGEITSDHSFTMTGPLLMRAIGEQNSEFDDVSLRLYDENGDLLEYECLGRISVENTINISFTHPNLPEYVIIISPDFWDSTTVSDFQVDYFYRIDYNEETQYDPYLGYDPATAFAEGDYPMNVTQDSPCT